MTILKCIIMSIIEMKPTRRERAENGPAASSAEAFGRIRPQGGRFADGADGPEEPMRPSDGGKRCSDVVL